MHIPHAKFITFRLSVIHYFYVFSYLKLTWMEQFFLTQGCPFGLFWFRKKSEFMPEIESSNFSLFNDRHWLLKVNITVWKF